LADKTGILTYLLVKNHPWSNGNKRMAMISAFLFLGLNGHWSDATEEEIRAHLAWIGASEARCFDRAKGYLRCYFDRKIVPLPLSKRSRNDRNAP
jgi:prophage maintenance system killer protein